MPISPAEAKRRQGLSEQEMKEIFAVIDGILSKGKRTIHVGSGIVPHNAKERVIADYTLVGWKVTYTSDQRDGDFLQFSE
jgi:hypothetical protein